VGGSNRKGQTIQKDGAQSHGPKLAVGFLSSVKRSETKSQELIWRLGCRSREKTFLFSSLSFQPSWL